MFFHHDGVIKHTIYDLKYTTRIPTWSSFKNKHDEGIMLIFYSYENSICVQVCRDALFAVFPEKSLISLSNDVHLNEKTLKTVGKTYTSLWKVPSVKFLKVNFLIGNWACAYQYCVIKTQAMASEET